MANIFFSILSTFNDKGLKKASKQVSLFEKQTKSLQATFLKTFSVLALLNYSRKAINAFAADEAAAKALETQLKNTGYAFSAPGVENYIAGLQSLYGVLDDQLRPAFQQLLTATGSITKSQDALEVALNVSAATGKSLTEVSAALTRGFSGNTAGLSRLGAGISKATLKAGDMDQILAELNDKFTGQAAAKLDTYAGKMGLLKVASANAAETIGKGLLDALTVLGKNTSISDTTKKIDGLATAISDLIVGLGVLGSKLSDIGSSTGLTKILSFLYKGTPLDILTRAGAGARTSELPANQQRSAGRISSAQSRLEDKLSKAKALELNTLLKKNAIENKNVEELRKKFDLERIGLTAALNSATDEETKLRLRGQLAILDNNDALAKKILAEMDSTAAMRAAADSAKRLAEAAGLASAALYALANRPNPIVSMSGELTARGQNQIPSDAGFIVPPSATGGSNTGTTIINTTVNTGTIIGEEDLTTLIADKIRVNLKYGNKLVPAGSIS